MSSYHNDSSGSRSRWGQAKHRLPFLESLGCARAPGVEAVVVGPDDLVEEESPSAVVPAGEAEVVGVVAVGDFYEVASGAGEQRFAGFAEVEALVAVEARSSSWLQALQ
jgi:hypothetical protein